LGIRSLYGQVYFSYTGFYNEDALPLADGGNVSKQLNMEITMEPKPLSNGFEKQSHQQKIDD